MDKSKWASGIQSELDFWKDWLANKGGQWPDDFKARADPTCELQAEIAEFVEFRLAPLKILDVGAGPMTYVGKLFRGVPVDLSAIDALGDLYSELDFPEGTPLVRTQTCDNEAISQKFPLNSFDVVFSRNALDHGYDPIKSIAEMIAVTKKDGKIITLNWANEADAEGWSGFHQWNFRISGGKFIISNKSDSFTVNDIFFGMVEIAHLSPEDSGVVHCVMRKKH